MYAPHTNHTHIHTSPSPPLSSFMSTFTESSLNLPKPHTVLPPNPHPKSDPQTHSLNPPPPPHNQHTEFCLPGKSRPPWGGCSSEGTGCRWLSVPPVCKQKHWHCCGGALSSPAKQTNCICSAANVMLPVYQLHCCCYWLKHEQRLMWRIGENHSNTTKKWCHHIPSLSFPAPFLQTLPWLVVPLKGHFFSWHAYGALFSWHACLPQLPLEGSRWQRLLWNFAKRFQN